ncbi:ABC transporter permease [Sphaerisporangium fuscum]|uniref:ABC transporter permease n=1 Tax=Sphaerisporangium fuscum TaxID=2835868 RepID=UPI002029AF88|nr:ABC transporter permease [Sphaerisporangium fuscum]
MSATTAHEPAIGGRAARGRLSSMVTRVWLVPIVLAAWEAGTRLSGSIFFPPPSQILVRMKDLWFSGPAAHLFLTDEALGNFLPSLGRMTGGWAAACLLGVLLGVAVGRSRTLYDYVGPLIEFGRAVPPPTLVPLFLVVFKVATQMQVATIVYGAIWPVLVNTIDGARHVDPVHADTAQVFGMGRRQRLFRIILPAAAPKIFAGLRLSVSLAVILMVISELVNSTDGIGYQLMFKQMNFDYPGMWGGIVLLGVLGLVLNALFLVVERRVLSWHRRARQTT